MTAVILTLLGPPSLQLPDGQAIVPQPGAKVLALLTFLVLEPGPHTREELAGLLWGDSPDTEARASLRQALKHLRSLLGEAVRIDRATVELAEPIPCDIQSFRQLALEEPKRALTTDVRRFLAGFSVRNAPRFDEWVAETRRELLRGYHQALGTLAREAMGQWRWRDAAAAAERWLTSDPLSDEAVRLLIEATYLSGDRGAALARFAEYRSALKRETGCQPSRALLSLVQRVEADATPVAARPVTDEWYARAPTFEAPLTGREEEWKALTRAWNAAGQGHGRIMLIEGEAGVGKSRLADEFLRWVVTAGGTALRGHGYDARAGVPFEPVVEVIRDGLNAPGLAGAAPEWLAEVARLVPELLQRFPSLSVPPVSSDPTESWRLFEGVAQLVLALAAERPVVVLIDDLQWCDGDSCKLLRFLMRRSERASVLWLGTLNLGELERDAPPARLCRILSAKPHASVLRLGLLSEEELWSMIREMGHVSTPSGARRFAQRVFGVTGGNPFYVVELLKTMFAQGMLSMDGESGAWNAAPDALSEQREFPVPRTAHEVIAERVERLPEPLHEVLVTLALTGVGCSAEMLSHIHGFPRLHAAALGDALVERRLVVEERAAYHCAHAVIARVVRDGLTPARRREVYRTLALALELLTPSEEKGSAAGEIARQADRGGERVLAYRYGLMAADSAFERYAYGEALSWLDLAGRNSRESAEADEVKRLTARVLEAGGWSEAPPLARLGGPITRGLEPEDLDLPVRS